MQSYVVFELEGRFFAVIVAQQKSFLALPLDPSGIHQLPDTGLLGEIRTEYTRPVAVDDLVEFQIPPPSR